jgi:hypothetical protein
MQRAIVGRRFSPPFIEVGGQNDGPAISRATQSLLFLFCIRPNTFVSCKTMIELEVYAAGLRDSSKILELDHELEAILDEPTVTVREIRAIFRRLDLDPRFIGAMPAELRPKTKTQLLNV